MVQYSLNCVSSLPENAVVNPDDETVFTLNGKKYHLTSITFSSTDGEKIELEIYDIIRITVEE
jgi:hypothetical protein